VPGLAVDAVAVGARDPGTVLMSGYEHPLVHVNRVDRSEPFCPCHDDPWALCPKWEQWGVTPGEKAEAERRAATFDLPGGESTEAALRRAEAVIESVRAKLAGVRRGYDRLQSALDVSDDARRRAEQERDELAAQLDNVRGHLDVRDGELVSANAQRDLARAQLASARTELEALRDRTAELERSCGDLENALSTEEENFYNARLDFDHELADVRRDNDRLSGLLAAAVEENERLRGAP
jgi:chromosome segregation ATPase